jgi:hypothetical protein
MNGLKFFVIAFCWLDSTVSTEELEPVVSAALADELLCELPPQPAISAVASSAADAASKPCGLIHRFIEEHTSL